MVHVNQHNGLIKAMKAGGGDYTFQEIYYSEKSVNVRLLSYSEKMKLYEGQ